LLATSLLAPPLAGIQAFSNERIVPKSPGGGLYPGGDVLGFRQKKCEYSVLHPARVTMYSTT